MAHTLIVCSGGMDSTTAVALADALGDRLTCVAVDYGQRHRRELDAAVAVAAHYGATLVTVAVPALGQALSGSALTDPTVPVPEGHYADTTMRATVVPNRNAILASIAVGVAQTARADTVMLGVHAGDHPIYPDCRPEFVTALDALTRAATAGYHTPRIAAPFVHHTKTQVCALAGRLGAPLHLTWSCYTGGELHCGRCGTCTERREAFADAGMPDPTTYAG